MDSIVKLNTAKKITRGKKVIVLLLLALSILIFNFIFRVTCGSVFFLNIFTHIRLGSTITFDAAQLIFIFAIGVYAAISVKESSVEHGKIKGQITFISIICIYYLVLYFVHLIFPSPEAFCLPSF